MSAPFSPRSSSPADRWALGLAGVLVLASRLPFLFAGYGADGDASRVFIAARAFALSGRYEVSRSLGYPLQEWVCALIWRGGPAVLNGASAVASVVAVLFFGRALRSMGARGVLLPSLALASIPIVYISSVSSMDYVWALALLMASLAALLEGRPGIAGIAFALATGCRVTSLFLLPSYALLAAGAGAGAGWTLGAAGGGMLFYVPVMLRYGASITRLLDSAPIPIQVVARQATLGVWGKIGLAALAAAILSPLFRRWLPSRADPANRFIPAAGWRLPGACALAIVFNIALYVLHPNEAAYFIAGLPFAIILLGRLLDRRVFAVFCAVLCLSPFVSVRGGHPVAGPILADHAERSAGLAQVQALMERGTALALSAPDSLVVIGRVRLPKLKAMLPADSVVPDDFWSPASNTRACVVARTTFVSRLTSDELVRAHGEGRAIFYLRDIRAENRRATELDLADPKAGASPLAP